MVSELHHMPVSTHQVLLLLKVELAAAQHTVDSRAPHLFICADESSLLHLFAVIALALAAVDRKIQFVDGEGRAACLTVEACTLDIDYRIDEKHIDWRARNQRTSDLFGLRHRRYIRVKNLYVLQHIRPLKLPIAIEKGHNVQEVLPLNYLPVFDEVESQIQLFFQL